MTHFRTPRRWAAVALAVGLVALAGRAEDEEPVAKKPAKKVVVDDDGPAAGNPLALPDIARAAAAPQHPALKKFFSGFVSAYDRLNDTGNRTTRVAPVPLAWGKDRYPNPFGVFDLTDKGPAEEPRAVSVASVRALDHFEPLALTAVEQLLNPSKETSPADIAPLPDRLIAAERLLTQVSFFHESAVEQGKRRGKGWEPIRAELGAKLADVRVKLVEAAAEAKDWGKVREQVARFTVRYKSQPDVLRKMAAVRLREAEPLAASERPVDLDRARDLLSEFDSRFPNAGHPVATKVRTALAEKARALLTQADQLAKTDPAQARNILRTVEGLDPDNADLRKQQKELRSGFSSLAVGAWRLPERMSPGTARYDSELQAVELMFEGLTDAVPDEKLGVSYRPVLISGKPGVSPLARDVTLIGNAEWAGPGRGLFDAGDIDGTLKLLRAKRELPSAEAVGWLADPEADPAEPNRVKVKLSRGHPDPRQLLTVKMLPAKWFQQNNRAADDAEFAAKPFGTGPYKLVPVTRVPNAPPPDVVFTANPTYFRRPGRQAQPFVKEIRFVDLARLVDDKPMDPVAELKAERLQIVPDFPTRDYDRYVQTGNATVATAAVNRRIHLLAFNLRDPRLQSADLRRGIQHAVDREKTLTDVYRAGKPEFHKALTGPFPVGSWAEGKSPTGGAAAPLFNRDLAAGLFGRAKANVTLELLYAVDDAQAKAACEAIAVQVATASEGRVKLTPEGVSPRDLYKRVEAEHRFSVAYRTHDYRDDWYPLGLATQLDPDAAGPNGRNVTGFALKQSAPSAADDALAQKLTDATRTRDFEGRLKPLAHDIHRKFAESVPFVPLWQLDRHVAVSKKVKVQFDGSAEEVPAKRLDPTPLLQNVSRWRVE